MSVSAALGARRLLLFLAKVIDVTNVTNPTNQSTTNGKSTECGIFSHRKGDLWLKSKSAWRVLHVGRSPNEPQ